MVCLKMLPSLACTVSLRVPAAMASDVSNDPPAVSYFFNPST